MKKSLITALALILALPAVGFAQILFPGMPPLTAAVNLYTLIIAVASVVLNATWIIAVAFVIVMFVVSGFMFLTAQGDLSKVQKARDAVIWGTGGIIVILLAFSILVIMRVTLGL